ncbi:uncharacterized protein LOC133905330 [Phragmites australis]|uniref:uncharacterized protein LOC133905330 n=1 Tax=Phragmites australis TaxID=29695 RepID=UPI002D77F382|nr:uncharacterized protein LOC133905330 [Phragmites australis]
MADSTAAAVTTSATSSNTTYTSLSPAISSVNIKALIPYTLSMESNNYRKWRNLLLLVLGRFNLRVHVEDGAPRHNDPDWVTENLQVLMWIYATIDESLTDMVMSDDSTAYGVWERLCFIFCANKPSRAVHLESEFHGLVQGDLSVTAYCHKLKTLADALADCDQPVGDRTLVHQLIRGLNPKFHVLKTIMPILPTFPSFMQARDYLLVEERSKAHEQPATTETAFVTTGASGDEAILTRNGNSNHSPFTTTNIVGRGRGYRGRGRGRGGRHSGGRGRQHQQQQPSPWMASSPQWPVPWSGPWRAPWTGASGPGVLGPRPPAGPAQAYPAMHQTASAPLQSSSCDINGLIQALHAMSLQSQPTNGDWYMDTGASSHMSSDADLLKSMSKEELLRDTQGLLQTVAQFISSQQPAASHQLMILFCSCWAWEMKRIDHFRRIQR